MGHANVSNLSQFFVRRLYAKGTLSISECVEAMTAADAIAIAVLEGDDKALPILVDKLIDEGKLNLSTATKPYVQRPGP